MKSGIKLAIILAVILIFSSCAYVHTKTPYDQNLNETELGLKIGTAGEMPAMRPQLKTETLKF